MVIGGAEAFAVRAPEEVLGLLESCRRFVSLDAHAAAIALAYDLSGAERSEIGTLLRRAARQGVLVSASEVRASLAAPSEAAADAPVRLERLFVPTRDRTASLGRSLASYLANLREHGRSAQVVVFDDSVDAAVQAANRAEARRVARRYGSPVAYCGEPEKRAFGRLLVRMGVPSREVAFALFPRVRYAGANRNAMLLHAAGEAFMSFDDDTRCALAAPPGGRDGTRLAAGQPHELWDELAATPTGADVLALLEEPLGRSVAGLLRRPGAEPVELGYTTPPWLGRLGPGARVLVSSLGVRGHHYAGSSTPQHVLSLDGPSRRRLLDDRRLCERALRRHRALVCSGALTLCDGSSYPFPSTVLALDHREVLPPFLPTRRGDDPLFGVELDLCAPEALFASVPHAVQHERPPAEMPAVLRVARERLRPAPPRPESWTLLRYCVGSVDRAALGPGLGRAGRVRALGDHLVELSGWPLSRLERALEESWRDDVTALGASLARRLREHPDAPPWWRREVERQARRWGHDEPGVEPTDLGPMLRAGERPLAALRRLVGRFGGLLRAWPDAFEAARELRRRGEPIAREIP